MDSDRVYEREKMDISVGVNGQDCFKSPRAKVSRRNIVFGIVGSFGGSLLWGGLASAASSQSINVSSRAGDLSKDIFVRWGEKLDAKDGRAQLDKFLRRDGCQIGVNSVPGNEGETGRALIFAIDTKGGADRAFSAIEVERVEGLGWVQCYYWRRLCVG